MELLHKRILKSAKTYELVTEGVYRLIKSDNRENK